GNRPAKADQATEQQRRGCSQPPGKGGDHEGHSAPAEERAAYRVAMEGHGPFGTLDFVYMPSKDVAADLRYFVDVLGGDQVFAIRDGATRVAMVTIGDEPPRVLLTDHLDTDAPILVYRVDDLSAQVTRLREQNVDGWRLELPMG